MLQKLFSLCFVFDSSGCPSPKRLPDSVTMSQVTWRKHAKIRWSRKHQSSRFMDVAESWLWGSDTSTEIQRIDHLKKRLIFRVWPLRVTLWGYIVGRRIPVNVSEMAGCKWILVLWWTMIIENKWCTCVFHFTFSAFLDFHATIYMYSTSRT